MKRMDIDNITESRDNLTESFLKSKVIEKGIVRWDIHSCSMCGYQCGFLFHLETDAGKGGSDTGRDEPNVDVSYDNGCYCFLLSRRSPRTFQDVINHIRLQSNENTIKKYSAFWGL
jgi:hypothetical protein